jgi:hypothetical protein
LFSVLLKIQKNSKKIKKVVDRCIRGWYYITCRRDRAADTKAYEASKHKALRK